MAVSTIPTPKSNAQTTFAGNFRRENVPITREQVARLKAGESATSVLGPAIAPAVVPPLVRTPSPTPAGPVQPPLSNAARAILAAGGTLDAPFKTEQLDPSGLSRGADGRWMYGGPQNTVVPLPWRTPETIGPVVPVPATTQPIPASITPVTKPAAKQENIPITPEQGRRLRAGEDPGVVLNETPVTPGPPAPTPVTRTEDIPITPEQSRRLRAGEDPSIVLGQMPTAPPTPAAPEPVNKTENIPITPEQGRRLREGEDPLTVLGPNILPQVPVAAPLPPSMTPESVGMPTLTPENQLSNPPWTPLSPGMIPDNMGHVITDDRLMELLQPMIPEAGWISDMIRAGRYGPIEPIRVA